MPVACCVSPARLLTSAREHMSNVSQLEQADGASKPYQCFHLTRWKQAVQGTPGVTQATILHPLLPTAGLEGHLWQQQGHTWLCPQQLPMLGCQIGLLHACVL